MPAIVLIIGYVVVALAPLALAWLQGLPPRGITDELASGLGLTAFAIMLVEFVLSGRFRTISRRIGSDVTMRFHQLLARIALVFALVHPLFYTTPFARPLPWDPARQDTLLYQVDYLAAGTLGWVLLIPFILLAVARASLPFRYETWRLLHGLGAAVIAAAIGYHALVGGRYSGHEPLRVLWFVLLAIAFATLLVVYVIKPFLQLRHRYRVSAVTPVAERTWEVVVEPDGGRALSFQAGQFAWLNIGHSPFTLDENPFSFASAPAERPRIRFLIKEVGDFTRTLGTVAAGTPAYLDGPHGHLTLRGRRGDGIVLLAGGVGLAPLISIARQARAEGERRPIVLVYGNRAASQIACEEDLGDLARELDLRVRLVLGEPPADWRGETGVISIDIIREACGGAVPARWLYLMCGPAAMLDGLETALLKEGVPARQIVSERFTYD